MTGSVGGTARRRPAGHAKWFMQAPKWVYRARLGFLFGSRFLLLEHTGRKSGKVFQTPLEVAHRRSDADEWVVCSGFGPTSDWYRNLQADQDVAIWLGSKRYPARARFLSNEEAVAAMQAYERAHPKAAAKLESLMGVAHDGTPESWLAMMERIPMVGLTPRR